MGIKDGARAAVEQQRLEQARLEAEAQNPPRVHYEYSLDAATATEVHEVAENSGSGAYPQRPWPTSMLRVALCIES
jgi:hypothetical protein